MAVSVMTGTAMTGTAMTGTAMTGTAVLRVGVLGCANIAWRRTLPAMAASPLIQLAAVASRDAAKAQRFADRFGCAAVHGYQPLLDRDDIQAVYLPLPAGLHAEWTDRALRSGRHVLVEKPATTGRADATRLVELAASLGLLLMENFMFLRHSQHAAVRQLIDDGRIGVVQGFTSSFGIPALDPGDIRYQPDLGGGSLLDVGVYPVRAAQLLLGDDLDVVGAVLREDAGAGVDVAGQALLCSADGVPAHLAFGIGLSYQCVYELWGAAGRIRAGWAFTPPATQQPVVRIESQDRVEKVILPADDQFANVVATFAGAILNRRDFGPHGHAIVRQADLVEKISTRAHRVKA